jgi:hypothetical protein
MEPGYNAQTNPDPAGDDYDRAFNPGGTEGNFNYDAGEPYDDVGVDGMRCPAGAHVPVRRGRRATALRPHRRARSASST